MFNRHIRTLLVCLALITCAAAGCRSTQTAPVEAPEPPALILVSIDGFRWDYLEMYDAPTLQALAAEGVKSDGLVPVFPSKTFPNHYTVVTGLYPENHGVVGNSMYDPVFDASFSLGNEEAIADGRWWGGEPVWVTAEQQGMTTATYFWPGSEAEIMGVRPTYWKPYDGRISGEERVEQVLEWLDLEADDRPRLITLYFSEVDGAGHRYGPASTEVAEAIISVDAALGMLVDGLRARGLYDDVNLLITSDHGMAATSPERAIILDEYINTDEARIISRSAVLLIEPEEGQLDAMYEALHDAHPRLTVYRKPDIPDSLHYRDHRRIPSIVGIADVGWTVTSRRTYEENPEWLRGGTHGYLPSEREMHGLFIARGPAFREGATAPRFENVHLYELMTALLQLEPAPNDGNLHVSLPMLKPAVRERVSN